MNEEQITVLERVALAFENTQKALERLHSVASAKSMMHLGLAVIAMVVLAGLLYAGQMRAESRLVQQLEVMQKKVDEMPERTARALHIVQTQNVSVEQSEGAFEKQLHQVRVIKGAQ
jgi:hypothetical protein